MGEWYMFAAGSGGNSIMDTLSPPFGIKCATRIRLSLDGLLHSKSCLRSTGYLNDTIRDSGRLSHPWSVYGSGSLGLFHPGSGRNPNGYRNDFTLAGAGRYFGS